MENKELTLHKVEIYRNDQLVGAAKEDINLSYRNLPATHKKKSNPTIPDFYNTKDKFSFSLTNVEFLTEFENLEGDFTVDFFSEKGLMIKLHHTVITLLDEVNCKLEGYSELYKIGKSGTELSEIIKWVTKYDM